MKYYTPELEEFFPGFEYEEYSQGYTYDVKLLSSTELQVLSEPVQTTEWIKRVYELQNFVTIIDGELSEYIPKVRVKYLDEQDIKDLGFESVWLEGDVQTFSKNNIIVSWWINSTHIRINYTTEWQLFDGQIKNKNELRKLMKQLGII